MINYLIISGLQYYFNGDLRVYPAVEKRYRRRVHSKLHLVGICIYCVPVFGWHTGEWTVLEYIVRCAEVLGHFGTLIPPKVSLQLSFAADSAARLEDPARIPNMAPRQPFAIAGHREHHPAFVVTSAAMSQPSQRDSDQQPLQQPASPSAATPPPPPPPRSTGHKVRRPRAARACNLCRVKKNKCDELYPCTYCRSEFDGNDTFKCYQSSQINTKRQTAT